MRPKIAVLLIFFLSIIFLASSASISEANTTVEDNSSDLNSTFTDTYTVEDGTVSGVNVSVLEASKNWAGIFGNASGKYILGSNQNSIFSWGSSEGRYVYLSEESINFSSEWKSRNNSEMVDQYSFVGGGSDGVSNTFSGSYILDSVFQNGEGINTTAAKTLDGSGSPFWITAYLSDGENGFFAGAVDSGLSYTGEPSEFQMILPEQGLDSDPTSYSVWIELQ